jgi:hypothetical protein
MDNNSQKTHKDSQPSPSTPADWKDETLRDLIRFVNIPWFASKDQGAKLTRSDTFADQAGPDVSLVDTARALADRARANDPDAALRLFIMAAVSQVEVWKLMREGNPAFKALAQHSAYLPVPFSPIARIDSLFSKVLLMLKVGKMLLNVKAKGNLENQANASALRLLGFMMVAKRGFVDDPEYQKWIPVCETLPPLSPSTWREWWVVGKDICPEMFPELQFMFYGEEADKPKKYQGDAVHRLGQSFEKMWPLFEAVESLPEKTTT